MEGVVLIYGTHYILIIHFTSIYNACDLKNLYEPIKGYHSSELNHFFSGSSQVFVGFISKGPTMYMDLYLHI